jgi:heme-degrading monooxygenase HmoA
MFVAIYSFDVKPTKEAAFLSAWEALTIMIKDHLGGWGSRIHKSDDGQYIAYAQWPSRDFWERDNANLLPAEASKHRAIMKGACMEIKTVYRLEMICDLLIHDSGTPQ